MGAWVLDRLSTACLAQSSFLCAIMFDFLSKSSIKNGHGAERVKRDENRRANLRVDALHLAEAFLYVILHYFFAEVMQRQ